MTLQAGVKVKGSWAAVVGLPLSKLRFHIARVALQNGLGLKVWAARDLWLEGSSFSWLGSRLRQWWQSPGLIFSH